MRTNAIPSMMDILSKNYNNRNMARFLCTKSAMSTFRSKVSCCRTRCQTWCWECMGTTRTSSPSKEWWKTCWTLWQSASMMWMPSPTTDLPSGTLRSSLQGWRRIWHHRGGSSAGLRKLWHQYPRLCGQTQTQKAVCHDGYQRSYVPMPKFPASTRDLALLCDDALPVMTMEKAIKAAAGKILEKIELFDVYKGKPDCPREERALPSTSVCVPPTAPSPTRRSTAR